MFYSSTKPSTPAITLTASFLCFPVAINHNQLSSVTPSRETTFFRIAIKGSLHTIDDGEKEERSEVVEPRNPSHPLNTARNAKSYSKIKCRPWRFANHMQMSSSVRFFLLYQMS